jgi:Rieske Fe-S protein
MEGGKIFADQAVVVTQPAAGPFKAFSATCTHKGCLLSGVADSAINCKCHGARFALSDGSVLSGPAKEPLAPRAITVAGDTISLG